MGLPANISVPAVKGNGAFVAVYNLPKAKVPVPSYWHIEVRYRLQGGGVDQEFTLVSK